MALASIDRGLKLLQQHRTYPRDLVVRYPQLQALSKLGLTERLPVSIVRGQSLAEIPSPSTDRLTFVIADRPEDCCCYYDTKILDKQTIERLLAQLNIFIDGIIRHPDLELASLPLLSESEAHQILVEWNDTQIDFAAKACIH